MALAAPPNLSDIDVPVQPLARTYPRGLYIGPLEHVWGQLLYAMNGVMWVETSHEALVVPPQRAVWLPPGVPHGIRVVSDLQMRNIYLRPTLAATLDDSVQVIEVGGLLRELIVGLLPRVTGHRSGRRSALRRPGFSFPRTPGHRAGGPARHARRRKALADGAGAGGWLDLLNPFRLDGYAHESSAIR